MKMLMSFLHSHVVSNLYMFLFYEKHKEKLVSKQHWTTLNIIVQTKKQQFFRVSTQERRSYRFRKPMRVSKWWQHVHFWVKWRVYLKCFGEWMDEPKIISTFSNRRCDKSVFLYSNQIIVSDRLFWCLLRRRQFKTCVKDWLTCHDPNCNPGGVSMCLSVPLWVEAQWRTPLLRPVCVSV